MRRLSTELGVALGATYHHVATKNALLALVAQDLYNDVSKPNGDVGTWEERLRSLMITQATVAAGYPGMGNFMMTHAAEIVPTDLNKLVRRQPVKSVKDFEKVSSGLKKGENVLILIDRRGNALFLSAKV